MTIPPEYFRRIAAKLDDQVLGEPFHGRDQAADSLTVHKHAAFIQVSDDVAMDYGLIPDTRPPVRIPWYRRLRWRFAERREQVGRKVGGWIAGVDLSDRDDDW